MHIEIVTLFPKMFEGILAESMLQRAVASKVLRVDFVDLREFGVGRHRTVDDRPYGGGPGMLLKVEPVVAAVEFAKERILGDLNVIAAEVDVILLSPQGEPYRQAMVKPLSQQKGVVLICGHYEGFDDRVRELVVTKEISIGDYVLTGGEIPAMVILDSVVRYLPGVLGEAASVVEESFSQENLLEYPQYTRPEEFRGLRVPVVLQSGDHQQIKQWRQLQQQQHTKKRRPDLWQKRLDRVQ